jgi:hypothetical protein
MSAVLDGNRESAAAPVDSDGDGLRDEVEASGWFTEDGSLYRTDPIRADSDGDGLTDGDEAGSLVEAALAARAPAVGVYSGYSHPLLADTDGDGLGDADEADLDLDPFLRDGDGDGIDDGREVSAIGTAPNMADTDGDGFEDGFEVANADSQGLDPLQVDVKVSKMSYATDFAIGSLAGDAWQRDSMAWLVGNLASSGFSAVPVIGQVIGPVADTRDAIASAIRGDWVSSAFSVAGVVPYAGDVVAIPGKAAKFVARNPELAATVAGTIVALNKVPERVKVEAAKRIWDNWDDLRAAGASEKSLLRLSKGRTDLDELAGSMARPAHVAGPPAPFFTSWRDGETYLEDLYRASVTGTSRQVRASTKGCLDICNTSNVRIFDVLVDGVAHESKVGYKTVSEVERQARSDGYLIRSGALKGAHWHFFASPHTNNAGASPALLDLLEEQGIQYTIHLPA